MKTKSKERTMSKTRLSTKGYYDKPFLKYSRLPRRERKYCSCVMAVRHRKYKTKDPVINPYAVCTYNVYSKRGKSRSKTLDCGINYDLDNYHIEYIKAYAKERGIPLTHTNKEGKRVEYSKSVLIKKLREPMIQKEKEKEARQKSQSRNTSSK